MTPLSTKSLIGKLNSLTFGTLESAAGLCLTRTNYNVEVEHWLHKILEVPNSDLEALLKYFSVDRSRLIRDLTAAIDRLKTGNGRQPALSPDLMELVRESWLIASVEFSEKKARSSHLLAALVCHDSLKRIAQSISEEFRKISPEALLKDLPYLVTKTAEVDDSPDFQAPSASAGPGQSSSRPGAPSKTPSLDQFTIDLTERALAGDFDPVLGRDQEIRQVIDILTRRRQNNPILTGEAGVGKTAVVEGFAQRIAAGDVPPALRNVSLRSLDLGLLQAGAGVKGEFENRLKSVIEEVKRSPRPIILFIDEAHTLIGAGGQSGQGDAANLLKPALARGELRTIAATTWAEYKKYFERDAALARRFQVVKVEEPVEAVAIEMIRGSIDSLEAHHRVRILDNAVVDAVKLSHRYISGRQLPDKAVSLIDTACARVAMSHAATPPEVEDCRRVIDQCSLTISILERESETGHDHDGRLSELREQKATFESQWTELNDQWQKELQLVTQIREHLEKLDSRILTDDSKEAAAPLSAEDRGKLRAELQKLDSELKDLQGETPLVQVCVDSQAIAEIVSDWTGIPVGRMMTDEIQTVLNIKKLMEERVVGQTHALEAIAQRIRTSRANLTDPRRPIGVFLLVGTSGVGKTETAVTLAELMYGGQQNMTVINMTEFKEEHKVSLLMGSPPGYVGYGEGGVLTEAVRRRPYSVVLLDEMEKAHPGVQDIFYQVFDKGMLRDGEGRDIDFRNTIIIMTSNAGTETIMKLCKDKETCPEADGLAEALKPDLLKSFKPAFLGRVTLVPYFPLSDEILRSIVELQLKKIERRIQENYKAAFTYHPEVVSHVVDRCRDVDSGARNIDHILTGTMLPQLASEFLSWMASGKMVTSVHVSISRTDDFEYKIN
jgi:type VI secretion system protein VasG